MKKRSFMILGSILLLGGIGGVSSGDIFAGILVIFVGLALLIIGIIAKNSVPQGRSSKRVPYSKRPIREVPLLFRKNEMKKRLLFGCFGIRRGPRRKNE